MTPDQAARFARELPEHAKVWHGGKVYDFGYMSQTGHFVLYEEGERNMQDSIAVDPELVEVSSEDLVASRFRGVEYRYHRDVFQAMSLPAVAEKFAEVWALCEPRMERAHRTAVDGLKAERWAEAFEAPHRRARFLEALCGVLRLEAEADEVRGRPLLARKLREIVEMLRSRDEEAGRE